MFGPFVGRMCMLGTVLPIHWSKRASGSSWGKSTRILLLSQSWNYCARLAEIRTPPPPPLFNHHYSACHWGRLNDRGCWCSPGILNVYTIGWIFVSASHFWSSVLHTQSVALVLLLCSFWSGNITGGIPFLDAFRDGIPHDTWRVFSFGGGSVGSYPFFMVCLNGYIFSSLTLAFRNFEKARCLS
jgi:hypothetical protein